MNILGIKKIYNKEKAEELFEEYLKLNSYDREIVNLFALVYHSFDVYLIMKILSYDIEFYNFRGKLEKLIDMELLVYLNGQVCIGREPRELILEHLSQSDEFSSLKSRVSTILSEPGFRVRQSYYSIIRDLRLALYSGDSKSSEELLKSCFDNYREDNEKVSLTLFNAPYSKKLIGMLPDYLKAEVLYDIIKLNLFIGYYNPEAVEEIIKHSSYLDKFKRAEIDLYIKWADLDFDSSSDLNTAINLVNSKEFEKAYKIFRIIGIPDSALVFYIITLINLELKNELLELLKIKRDSFSNSDASLYPLYIFSKVYLGEMAVTNDIEKFFEPKESYCLYGLWICLLCSYWLELPDSEKNIKKYLKKADNSIIFYKDDFAYMVKGSGTLSLIKPIPRWESVLNSLISSLKDEAEETKNKEQKLVWRIKKSRGLLNFTPVIQKLSKNGKWTRGRKIDPYDFEYMANEVYHDDKDFSMVNALCTDLANNYSYYESDYEISTLIKVLKMAIGKKNLFDEDTNNQVDIEEVPLSLVLNKSKDSIIIKFNRKIISNDEIIISKKENTWQVTFFDDKQYPLIELLGKGLKVPQTEVRKISEFLNNAESLINIEGDIKVLGKGLDEVFGKTEPQFFIEPKGNGLLFKLRSVPGDSSNFYLPGHGKSEFIGSMNGKDSVITRDLAKERSEADSLITSIPLFEGDKNSDYMWMVEDTEDSLIVLEKLKTNHENIILNWPKGKSLKIAATVTSDNLFNSVDKKREWFEVSGEFEIDKKRVLNLKKLMALSEASESRFIQLGNGEYLALTRELKKEIDTISTFSQKSRGDSIKLHPLALLAIEDNKITQFKESREWLEKFKESYNRKFRVPKSSKVDLRDYQQDGFLWMKRLSESGAGALLADDMGLGKTVQTIVLLDSYKNKKPSLIIVPASLVFNWYDEIKRFAPGLSPHILSDSNREEQVNSLGEGDILITSYGLIQRNNELFTNRNWSNLILDEAQAVKNSMTKRTKVISTINRDFTLMTTGTPIENHLGELWSLFNILIPGFLGSFENFKTKYKDPIEKNNNKEVKERLKKVISPFILRRTKEEVLTELPPKTEINLMVEMNRDERAFYEAVRERAVEKIENNDEKDPRFKVLAELTKLRQASCNPKLLDNRSKIGSGKLELFGEKIHELIESNHQALVFSQFVGHLKLIADFLDKKGIEYFYLDGSVPAKKRKDLVKGFQNGEKPLFLISLKAGGSGLNLTAADYIFHMDPWWNPAVEDQASDRAHRIGQERPVTVYRLISAGTIEEQIISLHKEKRELAESLLSDSATSLRLDTNELIKIISGR